MSTSIGLSTATATCPKQNCSFTSSQISTERVHARSVVLDAMEQHISLVHPEMLEEWKKEALRQDRRELVRKEVDRLAEKHKVYLTPEMRDSLVEWHLKKAEQE